MTLELEILTLLQRTIIFAEERNVFIKTKLIGLKINKNCNSAAFLCIISLKLPIKMQSLRSLML